MALEKELPTDWLMADRKRSIPSICKELGNIQRSTTTSTPTVPEGARSGAAWQLTTATFMIRTLPAYAVTAFLQ